MPSQLPTHCGNYELKPRVSEKYAKDPEIGTVFGRLTTVSEVIAERYPSGRAVKKVLVRCSCGGVKKVNKDALVSGFTLSCGCLHKESAIETGKQQRTHYASKTPEYIVWASMVQRCRNANSKEYPSYGAKGIDVCDSWLKFENFLADMGTRPFPKASLDRMDNRKGYEPGNVQWANATEQANNKSNSVRWLYKGKLWSLRELSEVSAVSLGTLNTRLYSDNWSVESAVETPVGTQRHAGAATVPATRHKLYPQP